MSSPQRKVSIELDAHGDLAAVYVTELNFGEGYSYISAHRSKEGAIAKLIDFAAREGIDASDYVTDEAAVAGEGFAGSETLDNDPEVANYAVFTLPLEP